MPKPSDLQSKAVNSAKASILAGRAVDLSQKFTSTVTGVAGDGRHGEHAVFWLLLSAQECVFKRQVNWKLCLLRSLLLSPSAGWRVGYG